MHKVSLVEEVVVRALRKRLNEIPDMVWGFARKMRLGEDIEGAVRKILRYGIADEAESKTKDDCCKEARELKEDAQQKIKYGIPAPYAGPTLHRLNTLTLLTGYARELAEHQAASMTCNKCGKPLKEDK